MPKIGILFDIDELEDSMYGHAAYKVLFEAIDTRQLAGCSLSDGDTNATLRGSANQYCIAVESPDASKIVIVKNALGGSTAKGLLPLSSRFLEDSLVRQEPLVLAARIDSAGELVDCQTFWITNAWKDSQDKRRRASTTAEAVAEKQRTPTVVEQYKPRGMKTPAASQPAANTTIAAAKPGESLIGKTLGQYQIIEEIGRGGMAVVYKAYQPSLTRHVAIKVLPPQFTFDQEFVERFMREARSAATLHHPNIITIYDVSEQNGIHYFVMEYIAGKTLDALAAETPMPLPRVARIIEQVANALDHAHSRGMIHRDIKPSNILVDENDRPVLTDFGLVRVGQDSKLTKTGMIVGTPEYMSPEQAKGEEIDWRTDIYSLGVVLYRMLAGTVPFAGSTPAAVLLAHVAYEPLPVSQVNLSVPKTVEVVVLKAMAKDRDRRYQSARPLAEDLQTAITRPMPAIVEAPTTAAAPAPPVVTPTLAPTTPPRGAVPVAQTAMSSTPVAVPRKAGGVSPLIFVGLGVAVLAVICVLAGVLVGPRLFQGSGGAASPLAVTPTPEVVLLAAPNLKAPRDGEMFTPNDVIKLEWEAVPGLKADDSYVVMLDCASNTSPQKPVPVKETSYTVPSSLYSTLGTPYECRWSVTVMTETGSAHSAPSATRRFAWNEFTPTRQPTATPTATSTPMPVPTPTSVPTATRLLPTSTPRPRPTIAPTSPQCSGGQVWNGQACVCPPDKPDWLGGQCLPKGGGGGDGGGGGAKNSPAPP